MDRFIVLFLTNSETIFRYLKSNMDRFIDRVNNLKNYRDNYLKSNMDRFIGMLICLSSGEYNI